jgi:hypothetical protein
VGGAVPGVVTGESIVTRTWDADSLVIAARDRVTGAPRWVHELVGDVALHSMLAIDGRLLYVDTFHSQLTGLDLATGVVDLEVAIPSGGSTSNGNLLNVGNGVVLIGQAAELVVVS